MLENIDQKVTEQLDSAGVPVAKPESETPATPPSGDDLAGQLAKATAKIAELQGEHAAEQARQEQTVAEARLRTAAAQAKAPSTKIGCTQQDMNLDRAIAKVGGRAFWAKLSPAQQAEALGVQGVDTPDKTIRQFFGRGSDAAAANRLHQSNPAEYGRLRMLARLKGIL